MKTILTVIRKEVLDNFRDRRTLLTAVVMGPLFGPLLFAVMINLSIEKSLSAGERDLDVPVIGSELAPNLMRFLESKGINAVEGPESVDDAIEAVKTGSHNVVVRIVPEFGEQLADAEPATIEVYSDDADNDGRKEAQRVRGALREYGQRISALRLMARGVSPQVLRPLNVDQVDVSTPSGRSGLLLGMMSYFFIFAMLIGGMYLAIDSTAGERERGSLEPLLSLPVTRDQLMLGKIFASCVFMALSLALSIVAFAIAISYLPLQKLGMTPNFGPVAAVGAFFILAPFMLLGASMMTLVASFTKSYKEAQTWVSAVLFAPTLPIIVVSILQVRPRFEFMFIPSLSQHLLLVDMVKNEPIVPLNIAASAISTLLLGALFAWLGAKLYRREGLLG
ncbi:MAG: ABC transporter permease [Gammaproteobacteria bacterium]|nr:ABC transporter permease [Gammaproteobacteria bacterium]